jgi:hypothetical protein
MGKHTAVTKPAETASFQLKLGTEDGYSVVITVEYPENHGLLALNALREAASEQYIASIMEGMEDDESVLAALKAAGISFASWDEEDDY